MGRVAPKWFCKNIAQFKQMINCRDLPHEIITHVNTFGFPKNNGPCDTSTFNYSPTQVYSPCSCLFIDRATLPLSTLSSEIVCTHIYGQVSAEREFLLFYVIFFSNSHSLFSDILAFAFLHVFFIVFVFSIFAMTFMTLSQNFRLSPTLLAACC